MHDTTTCEATPFSNLLRQATAMLSKQWGEKKQHGEEKLGFRPVWHTGAVSDPARRVSDPAGGRSW